MEEDDELNDEQYMKELYTRFRKDILEAGGNEYYTQEELLDIYDYAQDENDHLVMLFVLLTGARYYHDSSFLDERIAMLLSLINPDAARAMLAMKGRSDTPLWHVLDIALDCVDGDDPSEKLSSLMESDSKLDSESVIWLIDNLHAARRHDLILEYMDRMLAMAEDPAEVYHSAATALYNEGGEYLNHALAMVEELTKIDSFFVDGWILNARIEYQLEHYPQALQAIDYALALEPDNTEASWVKAMIMPMADPKASNKDIADYLKKVVHIRPDWLPATRSLAEAYEKMGNTEAMFETYNAFIERSTSGEDIIAVAMEALLKNPADPVVYLEEIDKVLIREHAAELALDSSLHEQHWNNLILDLVGQRQSLQAEWMFDYLLIKYGLKHFLYNYVTIIYRNEHFKKLVQFSETAPMIDEWTKKIDSDNLEAIFDRIKGWLYVAGALLIEKQYQRCAEICTKLLDEIPDLPYNVNDNVFVNGLRMQLRFTQQLAFHPEFIPEDAEFNPLTTGIDSFSFVKTGDKRN